MNASTLSNIIDNYNSHGYYAPIPFLSKEEVGYYRGKLMEIENFLDKPVKRIDQLHLFFPWAFDLVTHPKLMSVMEALMGPDILIHTSRIFRKPPFDTSYVSWHQDGRYSDLNAKVAPTIWIALSDSNKENGCVQVVKDSFNKGLIPHVETYESNNLLNHGEVAQINIAEEDIVSLELNAGEFSIHNVNLLHGSLANNSPYERCGFSLTITTPESVHQSRLPAVLARGRMMTNGLELWERPKNGSVEEGLNLHRELHYSRSLPYRV